MQLGRDLAGVGDAELARARELRRQLKAAQDAEHRVLAGMGGGNRSLIALGDRAMRISDTLDQTEKSIDAIVDGALTQARTQIAEERTAIEAAKAELAALEIE